MEPKPWNKSMTLWFNVLMTLVMSAPVIATAWKALTPQEAVLIDSIAGLVTGLGNVFLRVWFTEQPIDTPKFRATHEPVDDSTPTLWIKKS